MFVSFGCNTKGMSLLNCKKVLCCITCPYAINIGAFHCILVLATMQKTCSSFVQNLCFLRIVLLVKLVCIFGFSPVLAAVQMQ